MFDLVLTAEDVGSYTPVLRNFETMLKAVRRGGGGVPDIAREVSCPA